MNQPGPCFIGSYDKVLESLDRHMQVSTVIAPRGRLRNMRLERRLRERGVSWIEVDGREDFLVAQAALGSLALAVVAGFSWKIPQSMIDRCSAVINAHPGDLLQCRGPDPIAAGLANNHTELGACLHLIDSEAMDAGPLLARATLPVEPARGFAWHREQVMQLLLGQCESVFSMLAAGAMPVPQPWAIAQSRWYPRLDLEQRKKLYMALSIAQFRSDDSEF